MRRYAPVRTIPGGSIAMLRRDGCPLLVLTGPKGRIFIFVWTDGKPETCGRFQFPGFSRIRYFPGARQISGFLPVIIAGSEVSSTRAGVISIRPNSFELGPSGQNCARS